MFVTDSSGSAYGSPGQAGSAGGGFAPSWSLLSYAGKGLRAYGAYTAGVEQSRSLKAQARAKQEQARQVRIGGIFDQVRMNEDYRRLASTQRQLFGSAGVLIEDNLAGPVAQSRAAFVMDRLTHARNVASEAVSLDAEARQLKRAAKSAKRAGVIGAFSEVF